MGGRVDGFLLGEGHFQSRLAEQQRIVALAVCRHLRTDEPLVLVLHGESESDVVPSGEPRAPRRAAVQQLLFGDGDHERRLSLQAVFVVAARRHLHAEELLVLI